MNSYLYCRSLPNSLVDPLGLRAADCPCTDAMKNAEKKTTQAINAIIRKILKQGGRNRKDLETLLIKPHRFGLLTTRLEGIVDSAIQNGTIVGFPANNKLLDAPTIYICGQCIGSDKLGHFIEEGLLYYDIVHKHNKPVSYADAIGYLSEGLTPEGFDNPDLRDFLLNADITMNWVGREMPVIFPQAFSSFADRPSMTASPGDLAANMAGLAFWEDVLGGKVGAEKFDICDYVNRPCKFRGNAMKKPWDHTVNKRVPCEKKNPFD